MRTRRWPAMADRRRDTRDDRDQVGDSLRSFGRRTRSKRPRVTVWRLKAGGHGWLRDLEGIITADVREACQFRTPAEARTVARRLRLPVGLRVVDGPATEGYRRGL